MSHFSVLVIGQEPKQDLKKYWELDLNRQELENDPRAVFNVAISDANAHREFQKHNDKQKDEKDKHTYDSIERFMTDWHRYIHSQEHGGWGHYHNPNAKWDWFGIGGRWTGHMILKKGKKGILGAPGVFENKPLHGKQSTDQALKKNIDISKLEPTFAVVKDGKWYERADMGWWGITLGDMDDVSWEKKFHELVKEAGSKEQFTIVDCHI